MSKHTPGPWTVGEAATCSVWKGEEQVASCHWVLEDGETDYRAGRTAFSPREVREANAHLIAAAPDLLETLKAVAPLIDSIDRMLEGWNGEGSNPLGPMVHAAIAKAEGK